MSKKIEEAIAETITSSKSIKYTQGNHSQDTKNLTKVLYHLTCYIAICKMLNQTATFMYSASPDFSYTISLCNPKKFSSS